MMEREEFEAIRASAHTFLTSITFRFVEDERGISGANPGGQRITFLQSVTLHTFSVKRHTLHSREILKKGIAKLFRSHKPDKFVQIIFWSDLNPICASITPHELGKNEALIHAIDLLNKCALVGQPERGNEG